VVAMVRSLSRRSRHRQTDFHSVPAEKPIRFITFIYARSRGEATL
jgi:hypothetical protein